MASYSGANGSSHGAASPAPMVSVAETASTAVAAQATAAVQARYAMAARFPRNIDQVRTDLLKECKRPSFARVALYHKPIGKGIEGPSIRFAEAAIRCMKNMLPEVITKYDDADKRILGVSVTDLESNVTYTKDVTVTKTVERNSIKDGQQVLGTRLNSYGKTVYIVHGTDDDILNKENALVSKALRTLGLRHIPGDILDEALWSIKRTLEDESAKDPDTARRQMVDAFGNVGVQPKHLVEYLGHALDQVTPKELTTLRGIYTAIRDGETTWAEVMGAEASDGGEKEPAPSKTSRTKEALRNRREAGAKNDQEPPHDPQTGEVDHSYGDAHEGPGKGAA